MRNIRKTMKVKEVQLTVYDTILKTEQVIETTVTEAGENANIPEGCVLISAKTLNEKEVTYKMTPQEFVKYATIEK